MEYKCKILWAEDEDALREVLCDLLRFEGYHCTPVSNGLEAQSQLQKDRFELVISDFKMPQMNGSELLFWSRQNNYHLPFIFVAASVERSSKEELCLKDCCSSFLQKPFPVERLIQEVELARQRVHQFHCFGKTVPLDSGDYQKEFPGRHYMT